MSKKLVYVGFSKQAGDGMDKLIGKHLALRSKDYHVIAFDHANVLLKEIEKKHPSILIVSDTMYAGSVECRGVIVASKIRQDEDPFPVIIFSPRKRSEFSEEIGVCNVKAVFQLPIFNWDKFIDTIINLAT